MHPLQPGPVAGRGAAGLKKGFPSSSNIDIDLNGGVLDINGMNIGTAANTVGNLTLTNGSTIALKSGDATQDVYLKGMSITGTMNITGWGGTAGTSNAGTGGRLIFNGRPNGWANDDNGGVGFDGVDWGVQGSKSELISLGGGLYELVPLGAAVPEPSTLFATGGLLLLVAYHFVRKRSRGIS